MELGCLRDVCVERKAGHYDALHGTAIDDGQRARQGQAHGADHGVGFALHVLRGAVAEHLALGEQLRVHLQPDYRLVCCAVDHSL